MNAPIITTQRLPCWVECEDRIPVFDNSFDTTWSFCSRYALPGERLLLVAIVAKEAEKPYKQTSKDGYTYFYHAIDSCGKYCWFIHWSGTMFHYNNIEVPTVVSKKRFVLKPLRDSDKGARA